MPHGAIAVELGALIPAADEGHFDAVNGDSAAMETGAPVGVGPAHRELGGVAGRLR